MSARMLLRIVLVLAGLVVLWGALALFRRPARDASGALALPRLSLPDLSRLCQIVEDSLRAVAP